MNENDRIEEQLAAASPRWLEAMQVLTVRPGDVIVFRSSRHLPEKVIRSLTEQAETVFPDNKVLIMEELDVGVIRREES